MPTGKAQRKNFTEEEGLAIKQLRSEGKSVDTIAAILHAGKDRVRRFLAENNLDKYQPVKRNRQPIETMKTIVTDYPDFKNPACKGMPIDDFYPINSSNGVSASKRKLQAQKIQQTLDVCRKCEEQEKCLDYAIKAEPHGIWGGTTEAEREYLRLRLGIQCERDVLISRKSRQVSNAWHSNTVLGIPFTIKHSDIVEKRLSRRA